MSVARGHAGSPGHGRPLPPVVVVLAGVLALAALTLALLLAVGVLTPGVAHAQDVSGGSSSGSSSPYGGALDNPEEQVTDEQVLEVGMLVVGTINGLFFAGAIILSRIRGSSHAETRRALIARTGVGTVSEAPRRRRRAAA